MNGSVIWLGERECLLETSGGAFLVTDPSLVSSVRNYVDEAEDQSTMQRSGSLTAATLASLFEIAHVSPYEGPSVTPDGIRRFGSMLPRRQVKRIAGRELRICPRSADDQSVNLVLPVRLICSLY